MSRIRASSLLRSFLAEIEKSNSSASSTRPARSNSVPQLSACSYRFSVHFNCTPKRPLRRLDVPSQCVTPSQLKPRSAQKESLGINDGVDIVSSQNCAEIKGIPRSGQVGDQALPGATIKPGHRFVVQYMSRIRSIEEVLE